jgi:chromosome segregation ATPase
MQIERAYRRGLQAGGQPILCESFESSSAKGSTMKKYLLIGIIGTVALVFIGAKTNLSSYAQTFLRQVEKQADNSIPTKFEIERIRQEITSLDGDISQMIRPIAEYKAEIQRTRQEVTTSQKTIDEKKAKLLAHFEKVDGNKKFVRCNDKDWPVEKFTAELQRQTEIVKNQELNLKTKQQVLEAKEKSLKATQEQLAKVVSKKREYEARLAELEALDQSLQVARIASDIKIDNSRATQIEDALRKLEDKLRADGAELDLRRGENANLNLFEQEPAPLDLQALRSYLEGNDANGKVANNK